MSWEVHIGPRVFPLSPKGLVIGRADDADVPIVDPQVSRNHAIVRAMREGLVIEDTRSRHGVRVNGVPVAGRATLRHGDKIAICGHELVIVDAARLNRERANTIGFQIEAPVIEEVRPTPAPRTLATSQASPVDVLLAGAEDALARSDASACEFGLARLLELMRDGERGNGMDPATVRRYATVALRAAGALSRPKWISAVVEVHSIRPRVMHAASADALEGALARLPTYDRTELAAYVASIAAVQSSLDTYERFCLERLQSILAIL